MKILLITPLSSYTGTSWIPVGLGYIASMLKKNNHSVRLFDRFLRFYQLGSEESVNGEMKAEILSFKPDIIGFSTISPVIYDTVSSVQFIRSFYNGIIIAGGHHVTAVPGLTLDKIPGLDFVAAGEAEYTMLSIADGKNTDNISGLFSRNTVISSFKQSQIVELDSLPFPDYSIFNMAHYTRANASTINGFYLKSATIITSRGCANRCKFCSESLTYGRGIRFHSPDYVIENIEKLVLDYKVNGIYFLDNDFLSSRAHAESICLKIIEKNLHKKIKWAIQACTTRINDEVLSILSRAGCVKIEFGMESINDKYLKSINKNASASSNENAIKLCKKHGIKNHTYFMTGFENEVISDLDNFIFWIKKFKPHTFSLHPLKIYPGTPFYEKLDIKFFEKNPWTRDSIENYFKSELLSSIDKEDKNKWYSQTYKPFHARYQKRAILKVNSLYSLLKMVLLKFSKKLRLN